MRLSLEETHYLSWLINQSYFSSVANILCRTEVAHHFLPKAIQRSA